MDRTTTTKPSHFIKDSGIGLIKASKSDIAENGSILNGSDGRSLESHLFLRLIFNDARRVWNSLTIRSPEMQVLFSFIIGLFTMVNLIKAAVPIRHVHIDVEKQSTYIVNYPTHQIGLGVSVSNLLQCIYLCQNHDYCRTAVFDGQAMICLLFEECSSFGDIVSSAASTVISFQLCENEPESVAFSPPLTASISMSAMMSNLTWIESLPASASWHPFFVVDQLYVPLQTAIDVYELEFYQRVQTIQIPLTTVLLFLRADSQGTFIYNQPWDPNIYIYSSRRNTLATITSALTNFFICYSTSFIVITSGPLGVADVYLRIPVNNSAAFLYRISGWNWITSCVIIKDQQLIGSLAPGGLQTTMLSKTTFNSTLMTLPLNASYLPTGAAINIDAAGRLYTAPTWSQQMSRVYLPDGRLIGINANTHD